MKRESLITNINKKYKDSTHFGLRAHYLKASQDLLFLSDINEIEKAFRKADIETAKMIDRDSLE